MSTSDPTARRTAAPIPGPLPAAVSPEGTGGAAAPVVATGAATPPPTVDGARAASDLRDTEASREGGAPTPSARDAYRSRVDRLRERIRTLGSQPNEADRGTALTEILAEARSLETSGDTNYVVDDLIAVRSCYRALSARARDAGLTGRPDFGSIATSLTRVEGSMRAVRDIFRTAVRPGSTYSARDRLHMSRLAIRLSQDLTGTAALNTDVTRESAELITDYRNELTLLRGVGSEELPDRDRADRIGQDMTALFELRGRLRHCVTHEWIENHDVALITDDAERQIGELYTLMRDYANDLHNSTGFIESSHASDAIDRLMGGIIEGEREALVPRLSAEGLTEYCRLSAAAEASFERARGLSNPAERRTALAEALQGFVSLGDSTRVDEVYNAMVASLPADASDTLRLQVFTAMGSILHGSGMEAETRLRELASPIAMRLATTPTPERVHREIEADETIGPGGISRSHTVSTTVVNERAYLDTASSVLAARSFFSAIGDSSAASGVDERLRTLRDQMDSQIGETTGRLRTELAASTVEIDMAVDGTASAGHLGAWRDAIRSATDLPTDDRLAQTRALVRVATLCRREAESSGTSRPDLAEIDSFATTLIGDIAADRIRHLSAGHHIDPEFSAAVTEDFRNRLTRAVTEGDGSWLGAISENAIDQFASLSQSGHVLLSGLHTPPTRSELQSCLQASAVFARLGLSSRVNEAMAPLLTHAEGITDLSQRANFYLSLGQVLQEGGMTTEANQMLDRIASLDGPEAPRDLHRLAEMVPAMREMNLGHLDRARDMLASIHGNPRATEMLHNVEGAMRRSRSLQVLDALRMVASDYVAQETERGATPNAAEINHALDEAQRLITSGRCSSVREALSRFDSVHLRNLLLESSVAGPIDSLLDSSASIASSDDAFSDEMLAFASALPGGHFYSSASQIGNLLTRNPHTRDRARSMVDGIPGTARLDGILTEIGNMSIIFAESDRAALRSGVVTLATFGLGRVAAAGAELAFAAYATESAIASSMALRATGFVVRSTAEAATFTLSSMAFESLFSGRTDNWTLGNFGRQFGAMMVTFMLCHGIGMGTSGLGRAAARTSLLGEAAAEGGGRTLSLTGRAVMGTVGYGATITGLTGVEYLNEALGLHPSEGNVPFLTRLLGSAVMDAQMRMAGRLFNEATGGVVERWEGATRRLYDIHELLPAVERLGYGRPDARGEFSPEQALVLNALLARVAGGESASEVAASIGREDPDLTRITSMVLGIDARSAEGRTMQALLFHYRATHPDANLAEAVGNLQLEAGRLARAAGLREGPEYEIVRAELFRRALRTGSTAEGLRSTATAFTGMRAGLEGVANSLLGPGGASSLEGQRLIGRLLLRSLSNPEGLSVEASELNRVREQVRGMGLDPTSATGRRMAADLLLARLDTETPNLSLGTGSEAGGSRLDGGVLHIDFRTPGFRHIPIEGHGEVWFGETAVSGQFRFDNHTGETVTVIRARDLPEGSEHSMTETVAPETADAPPGHTILRPGDRIRFADGREIVVGEAMRPEPAVAAARPETAEGAAAPVRAGSEDATSPGTPRARRGTAPASPGSEDATAPGTPRARRGDAPVIPLHAAAPETGEPDLLAAFRHADPSEPPSRGLLQRAFALADRLTRELGLNPAHDGSVSRAFRAAMARRAAEGPVTESMLREIRDSFRTLEPSLNAVDPLMRTEVRRRLFTRMLSGEITPERARELGQQLRNGEVQIEPAASGGLTLTTVPTEGRPAARALAERRLFDHLVETHFPEDLQAQLREGFENGQVTLARVETAVGARSAVLRFIADSGTEVSSERGHQILSRVMLDLATGRLEVREGRIVRPHTAAGATEGLGEVPITEDAEGLGDPTIVDGPRDGAGAPRDASGDTAVLRAGARRAPPPVSGSEGPAPVSDGSLPTTFTVETRRYVVESAEAPGTGLGRGEILIDLENPPDGRTPIFRSLLADTEAFADSANLPEPRRFIYTPENNIVIEFESGGARRRVFLRHPDIGRSIGGPAAAEVRLEGDTLHLDFSNSRAFYANVRIPNREGSLRFVEGDAPRSYNVMNFSREPFTVVRTAARGDLPATELVLPETTTGRSRSVEVRSGDRIRFADGREITVNFELPAERARTGESPPPDAGPREGSATAVVRPRGRAPEPAPPPEAGLDSTAVGRPRPRAAAPAPEAGGETTAVGRPRPRAAAPTPEGRGETTAVGRPRRGATDAAPASRDEPVPASGGGEAPAPLSDPVPLTFVAGPGGIHQAEIASAQVTLEANGSVSVGHPDHEVRVEYRGTTHNVPADEAFVLDGFREGEIVGINGRYFVRAHHGFREVAAPPTVDDIVQRFNRGERITTATGGHFSSVFDLGDGRMVKVGETAERQAVLDNEQRVLGTIHFNIAEHPEIYGALADFIPALIGRPDPAMLLLSRVPGRTLESLRDENPASLGDIPTEAWDRFQENLALLNRMGIQHGDISLSNILWDGTTLRLIDFGQAGFVEAVPGARESWDSNSLHRLMGPLDPRFARVTGTRMPSASDFERAVAAPELGFHPAETAETAAPVPEAPPPPASTILPPPPVAEAPVAPVIPLRPSVPTIAEPSRIAAFAGDVAVMGDTVLIGEEVFHLQTTPADAVLGEVPPVARTVFRFANTTIDLTGSGRSTGTIALALPTTYSAEDAARMISRLSPSVRRSLGRLDPAAAGRIVEMSERMRASPPTITVESYALPASEGGGSAGSGVGGSVVCTGEIVGVGSGRTTFRGYVVEADGTRRPVALVTLTHSMGGTFDSEAANLGRLAEAGVGEVRFDGTVRLDGRRALVVNLAEGSAHVGMGDLPARDRADFNVLMARDLARMSVAGLTSSVGTDFQYVWGRDSSGRPHLQWIDTESSVLPIDDARSTALRARLGRETLTAQDWYLENLRGFGLYTPATATTPERFSDGVPHTFQEAIDASPAPRSSSRGDRSSTIPPPS